jgi:hypothetical protein
LMGIALNMSITLVNSHFHNTYLAKPWPWRSFCLL